MKNSPLSTLSNKTYSFNILDSIQVEVHSEVNHFRLPIESLFLMAARINKKRSFLFVSKLIGKHLPIWPQKGLIAAALLAARYYESVRKGNCSNKKEWAASLSSNEPKFTSQSFIPSSINPLIIGFAETATALGHAFFDCFEKADYFHTTREVLKEHIPLITFEEEHSHATSHRCYIPSEKMENSKEIILVDDELTTGKTALNIIRSIQERFPRKKYSIAALLDWRSEENIQEFKQLENMLDIKINVVSLLSGKIDVKQNSEIDVPENKYPVNETEQVIEEFFLQEEFTTAINASSILGDGTINTIPYLRETGRFGLESISNSNNQQTWNKIALMMKEKRCGTKTLCLGTGEFMYIPMKIAAEMGKGVSYQSTTRSPIFIQNADSYGARFGLAFPNPEDKEISHYIYNIPPGYYDDLFIFFEREVYRKNLAPFLEELKKTQIKSIKLVYFNRRKPV